ncbi:DUF559 domain-containing protein [Deinococcus ruber]|uniref:DUF559 domain-containing protein n=1 Tax=Deinococcus ruber TaxID=1848197 RepID=A0A918C851_9DEIO|nr:DUF559 domain-containing protein [Deinococcus ruber]GGR11532.1 hypothetical protein GCM10008957_25570 [Deinococcus ruber]
MPGLSQAIQHAEAQEDIGSVLAAQLDAAGLRYIREHRFLPPRKWRLDYFFPERQLAVELEGINHRKRDRYGRDLEKYNAAATAGLTLLRFTAVQVHDETALREIAAFLEVQL